ALADVVAHAAHRGATADRAVAEIVTALFVRGARQPIVDAYDFVAADVAEIDVTEAAAALAVGHAADAVGRALVLAADAPGGWILVADSAAALLGRRAGKSERPAARAAAHARTGIAELVAALLVGTALHSIGGARLLPTMIRRVANLGAALECVDA